MSIDDYGDALDRSGRVIEELSRSLATERAAREQAEAALEALRDVATRAWRVLDIECPNAPETDNLRRALVGEARGEGEANG